MTVDDLVRAERSFILRAGAPYIEKRAIDTQHLRDLLIGGGLGAVGGGIAGASKGKEHRGRNIALGALLGGGVGTGAAEILRRTYHEDELKGARASADRINKAIKEDSLSSLWMEGDGRVPPELRGLPSSSLAGAGIGALTGAGVGALTANERKERLKKALYGALLGGGVGFVGGTGLGSRGRVSGWNTVTRAFNDLDFRNGPLTGVSVSSSPLPPLTPTPVTP